jgi:hypothetical protein
VNITDELLRYRLAFFIPENIISLTKSSRFHSASSIDGITKQTISRHFQSHHSGNDGSGVDTNPELEVFLGHVTNLEVQDGREKVKRHGSNLTSVLVTIADREARYNHIYGRGEREGGGRERGNLELNVHACMQQFSTKNLNNHSIKFNFYEGTIKINYKYVSKTMFLSL